MKPKPGISVTAMTSHLSVVQRWAVSSSVQARLDDVPGARAHAGPTTSGHVTRTPTRPFAELAVTWTGKKAHLLHEVYKADDRVNS